LIDVVIPVFKGLEQTRRAIESVLAAPQRSRFELVVIDDASPEPPIASYVDGLAVAGRVRLVRNASNQGFVRSVNLGMSLHPDRDVVLLNSDAEVANDWLDRLHASAHGNGRVATVTPFSNNATICSYPYEGWSGGVPGTLGLATLDRLFATTHAGRVVELPTAIGFCVYIRRDALEALGLFDAERFGRGYGEENDFCMRASKAGWRNLLAADVFVFHEGSVSFCDERHALSQAGHEAMVEMHPDYPARVHAFLVDDPAAALRSEIDVARAMASREEALRVLEERLTERARIMGDLWEIGRLAAERTSPIGQLNRGVAYARAVVADRSRRLAEREAEIGRLRADLASAEKLALERGEQLERIHASRLWRLARLIRRLVPRAGRLRGPARSGG
jgi:GT2 family glycosyltransferase